MNWFRKVVEVEKVVLGSPEPVTLYKAFRTETSVGMYGVWTDHIPLGYYHSCAQALSENPKAQVTEVKLWKIGNMYLTGLQVTPVDVHPKPKRAKGKA